MMVYLWFIYGLSMINAGLSMFIHEKIWFIYSLSMKNDGLSMVYP
jgi:hypothetical protein